MKYIVFDIDGVLADCSHRLHYIQKPIKDYDKFYSDKEILKDKVLKNGQMLFNANDWEKEEDGYFKLWCFDKLYYEYKWYKHFMRGLEVKRHDEEREVFLSLVLEFLEDIDKVEIR